MIDVLAASDAGASELPEHAPAAAAALAALDDAVAVLDGDGLVRDASPSVAALGLGHGAIVGTSAFDLVEGSVDGTDPAAVFRRVLSAPGPNGPRRLTVKEPAGRPTRSRPS